MLANSLIPHIFLLPMSVYRVLTLRSIFHMVRYSTDLVTFVVLTALSYSQMLGFIDRSVSLCTFGGV